MSCIPLYQVYRSHNPPLNNYPNMIQYWPLFFKPKHSYDLVNKSFYLNYLQELSKSVPPVIEPGDTDIITNSRLNKAVIDMTIISSL